MRKTNYKARQITVPPFRVGRAVDFLFTFCQRPRDKILTYLSNKLFLFRKFRQGNKWKITLCDDIAGLAGNYGYGPNEMNFTSLDVSQFVLFVCASAAAAAALCSIALSAGWRGALVNLGEYAVSSVSPYLPRAPQKPFRAAVSQ